MNSTNRLMGDATNQGVPALAQVPGLQLVAGYVTGRAMTGIMWLPSDWAQFPGITHVYIDQGSDGSPVPAATVRDVEPGAWLPQNAVNRLGWNTPRPTIYCDQFDLSRAGGVLDSGWQGDLWLAIPGWQPGDPLPAAPGCTIVAVQNQLDVANAYDLSVVLDSAWPDVATYPPKENDMRIVYGQAGRVYLLSGGRSHLITTPVDLNTYIGAGILEVGGPRQGGLLLTTGEETAFLADFPPGNPAVTVNTPPPPKYTITGNADPQ